MWALACVHRPHLTAFFVHTCEFLWQDAGARPLHPGLLPHSNQSEEEEYNRSAPAEPPCARCAPRIRPTRAPFGLPTARRTGHPVMPRVLRASVSLLASNGASRLDAARARLYHLDNTSSAKPVEPRVDSQHERRENAPCAPHVRPNDEGVRNAAGNGRG